MMLLSSRRVSWFAWIKVLEEFIITLRVIFQNGNTDTNDSFVHNITNADETKGNILMWNIAEKQTNHQVGGKLFAYKCLKNEEEGINKIYPLSIIK